MINKNKKTYEKFSDFFSTNKNESTSSEKDQTPFKLSRKYVLALLGLGICWMIASSFFSHSSENTNSMISPISKETSAKVNNNEQSVETIGSSEEKPSSKIENYEKKYEQELTETLNNLVGVSNVKVKVNLDGSEKNVYQTNKTNRTQQTEELDKQGGKRNIDDNSIEEQVVIINNAGKETPVVVQTEMPEVRGVLVIAKGAEKIEIKQMIREAVTRLLDVPSYRVSVLPKK